MGCLQGGPCLFLDVGNAVSYVMDVLWRLAGDNGRERKTWGGSTFFGWGWGGAYSGGVLGVTEYGIKAWVVLRFRNGYGLMVSGPLQEWVWGGGSSRFVGRVYSGVLFVCAGIPVSFTSLGRVELVFVVFVGWLMGGLAARCPAV